MKIMRFFGVDSASAMEQVKQQLGDDAIIFSHKNIREGVEILATVKTPGANNAPARPTRKKHAAPKATDHNQARIRLHAHLLNLGLGETLAGQLAYESRDINFSTPQTAIRDAHAEITARIPTTKSNLLNAGRRIALLGPKASGKTTTLAKLAHRANENDTIEDIVIITADTAATSEAQSTGNKLHKQLATLAMEIKVGPMHLGATLERLANRPAWITLIDTPALSQHNLRNPAELPTVGLTTEVENYLVLPADQPLERLQAIARSLTNQIPLQGCVVTMVDKADSLGHVIATIIEHQLPVALWTDGPDIDSHLFEARAKHLVEKAVAITRNKAPRRTPMESDRPGYLM